MLMLGCIKTINQLLKDNYFILLSYLNDQVEL